MLGDGGWSYYDMWYGWIGEFKLGRTDNAGAAWDTIRDFWGGQVGLIIRTSDAGQTWASDSSDFTSDLYDVCMLDSTYAWAVGENGLVLGFGDWAIGVNDAGGAVGPRARLADISVRPNPCRDRATLSFSSPLAKPTRMTLVDVSGRVLLAVPARAGVRAFDLDPRKTPRSLSENLLANRI